jgi:predicted DNA-binding protein (MmcQ/YjbR family)
MARHSWVTVTNRKLLPIATLRDLLAESHRLVGAKLPRKTRQALGLE